MPCNKIVNKKWFQFQCSFINCEMPHLWHLIIPGPLKYKRIPWFFQIHVEVSFLFVSWDNVYLGWLIRIDKRDDNQPGIEQAEPRQLVLTWKQPILHIDIVSVSRTIMYRTNWHEICCKDLGFVRKLLHFNSNKNKSMGLHDILSHCCLQRQLCKSKPKIL